MKSSGLERGEERREQESAAGRDEVAVGAAAMARLVPKEVSD
jgi:hypothetical protein